MLVDAIAVRFFVDFIQPDDDSFDVHPSAQICGTLQPKNKKSTAHISAQSIDVVVDDDDEETCDGPWHANI